MKGVIFVAGVYGVGKSTLCEKLSKILNVDFYSAGDLISEHTKEVYGKNKKVSNKENNQNVLIESIKNKLKEKESLILAGHFCILGQDDKPDVLPTFVYEKISISTIILLEAPTDVIVHHLQQRDKKTYSSSLIEDFILQERKQAEEISRKINVPVFIQKMKFDNSDINSVITCLKEAYDESIVGY